MISFILLFKKNHFVVLKIAVVGRGCDGRLKQGDMLGGYCSNPGDLTRVIAIEVI